MRWLKNVVRVVYLLAWLLVVFAWIRSYWHADVPWLEHSDRSGLRAKSNRFTIQSSGGGLSIWAFWQDSSFVQVNALRPLGQTWEWGFEAGRYPRYPGMEIQIAPVASWGRIYYYRDDVNERSGSGYQSKLRGFVVPYWIIAATLSLLIVYWVWRVACWWKQEWRNRHGLCFFCGYDLRRTVGRCPECGSGRKESGRNGEGRKMGAAKRDIADWGRKKGHH